HRADAVRRPVRDAQRRAPLRPARDSGERLLWNRSNRARDRGIPELDWPTHGWPASLSRSLSVGGSVTSSCPSPTAASRYWEARAGGFATEAHALGGVCSYGMPLFYTRYIHLTQRAALRQWLRPP